MFIELLTILSVFCAFVKEYNYKVRVKGENMIKLAICDADMMARKNLKRLCEKYFEDKAIEYQIEQYSSGEELLTNVEADVLLLDVKLKRISGILVKEILEKIDADTRMLFVSENRNHMADAFGKNVYGYLVKPVKENVFFQKLNEMILDIHSESQYVFCKNGNEVVKVCFKDILYIEVAGRMTKVYVKQSGEIIQRYTTEMLLCRWEEVLPLERFVRVNKRQIVNLSYIVDIKNEIELINQIIIPIGAIYKERFGEKVNEFRGKRKDICRYTSRTN